MRGMAPRWLVSFSFLSDRLDQFVLPVVAIRAARAEIGIKHLRVPSHLVNSLAVRIEQQHVFAGSVARLKFQAHAAHQFFHRAPVQL